MISRQFAPARNPFAVYSAHANRVVSPIAIPHSCGHWTFSLRLDIDRAANSFDAGDSFDADNTGFVPIFDGKTLSGWDGDPRYWRVEDGSLVGEVTPDTLLKVNTFIIWRGGITRDFELKADYRISAKGNSGINYRSVEVPGMPWVMRGYQADIDGESRNPNGPRYTGQNYEERGRLFLALRGQVTRIETGKIPEVIGSVGDTQQLAAYVHGSDDWNHYFLIVRGNVLIHILNGQVMSIVVDDDPVGRKLEGELGVQVHVGPPMKVEFKNILYKAL